VDIGKIAHADGKVLGGSLAGLSYMTFSELPEETSEEVIIPPGSFEFSFDGAFRS
jgi:hypothetical protein